MNDTWVIETTQKNYTNWIWRLPEWLKYEFNNSFSTSRDFAILIKVYNSDWFEGISFDLNRLIGFYLLNQWRAHRSQMLNNGESIEVKFYQVILNADLYENCTVFSRLWNSDHFQVIRQVKTWRFFYVLSMQKFWWNIENSDSTHREVFPKIHGT